MKHLILTSGLILMTACSAGPIPEPQTEEPVTLSTLAGSEWQPSGQKADDLEQFVAFQSDGKINGFAGCNSFFGTYTLNGETLKIGPLASTRKMCAEHMAAESAFLQGLQSAERLTATALELTLKDGADTPVMTLQRRDWD